MGFTHEVREYLEWYSRYQYENGKVPCVNVVKAVEYIQYQRAQRMTERYRTPPLQVY